MDADRKKGPEFPRSTLCQRDQRPPDAIIAATNASPKWRGEHQTAKAIENGGMMLTLERRLMVSTAHEGSEHRWICRGLGKAFDFWKSMFDSGHRQLPRRGRVLARRWPWAQGAVCR